ncbi:MAG: sigma-70 family RNA polymerase sigma factor [Chitinophagaceae bacterium]|nr:sigma-70 family RNA polymerase sigma factor [Chitinophagaceae bacterium]
MIPEQHTRPLISYAYNILGSYQDAKDVVQDVMVEVLSHNSSHIENEKAYLVRSVINRAINLKNKQKNTVSEYPGNWLPEPVATEGADHALHRKDILSYSLMVLMEKLDARSRAVFILKEAFDYSHEEIASVLDLSPENSRKILSRAKKILGTENVHITASGFSSDYLNQYIDIIRQGDTKRLEALLNEDIVATSDGGGKAAAAQHPIIGRDSVLRFISGIFQKFYIDAPVKLGTINHQPAIFYFEEDKLVTCQIMDIDDELIKNIYFIRNPDKLSALESELSRDMHALQSAQ